MCDFPLNKPFARNRSMELMDFAVLGLVSAGFSMIFGALYAYGTVLLRDRRVHILEQDVSRLEAKINNFFSNQKQASNREIKAQEEAAVDGLLGAVVQKVMIEGKKFEDLKTDPSMAQHASAIPILIKRYTKE